MNEEQYLATVHEQIQAYGYEPRKVSVKISVEGIYSKQEKKGKWEHFVFIMKLDEEGVAQVREASKKIREVAKGSVEGGSSFWEGTKVHCLLLLIPPSISEQMEIFVQEGHETLDADAIMAAESWVYPILVDLENERLVYRESTGLKKILLQQTLHNPVEKLFQI